MKMHMRMTLAVCLVTLSGGLVADEEVTILGQPLPKFDATLRMPTELVAVGVGYAWGRGVLSYEGQEYAFCVRGVSLGEVGVVRVQADGLVFHLQSLEDSPGSYLALSAGVALVAGESAAVLKNKRGVTIQLDSKLRGAALSLAGSRIKITLAGRDDCAA